MFTRRRLKIKLLFIQLLTIIPFLIFIFYLFDLWYDARRSQVLSENLNYTRLVGENIKDFIVREEVATKIISEPSFYDTLMKNKEGATLILENILAKTPELYNITIADTNGMILATTLDIPKEQLPSYNMQDRDYFQEIIKTRQTATSALLVGKVTNEKLVISASPVIRNNELVAVVTTSVEVEKLKNKIENLLSKSKYASKYQIILLDNTGQIVFISNQSLPNEVERSVPINSEFYKRAKQGETYFMENVYFPIINKKVMGTSISVNSYGWVVISVVPIEEIFAPLVKIQSIIWLIIGSAILFSVAVSSYLIRKIKIVY
jgi:hypothetical protein